MPEDVEKLLHRRTDLSTFVVHLTRRSDQQSALDNLVDIISGRTIEATTAFGAASEWTKMDAEVAETQRCVCFSEAPLEQTWMLCRDINGRNVKMEPYGVVFTKPFARRRGANPVWYLDITPGHDWLTNAVNTLLAVAKQGHSLETADKPPVLTSPLTSSPTPARDPILQLTPFVEQMGPTGSTRKEFWWEREWRHVGHFTFGWSDVVAVLAPSDEHKQVRAAVAKRTNKTISAVAQNLPLLDPEWGLERMISELADVDPRDAGPLPG